jgi:hypothetical protein
LQNPDWLEPRSAVDDDQAGRNSVAKGLSIARLRVMASSPPLVIIGTAQFIPAIGWPAIVVVILTMLPPVF